MIPVACVECGRFVLGVRGSECFVPRQCPKLDGFDEELDAAERRREMKDWEAFCGATVHHVAHRGSALSVGSVYSKSHSLFCPECAPVFMEKLIARVRYEKELHDV